jgi:hypothetical protein
MAEKSLTESAALVKIIKQFFEAAPAVSAVAVASETREADTFLLTFINKYIS